MKKSMLSRAATEQFMPGPASEATESALPAAAAPEAAPQMKAGDWNNGTSGSGSTGNAEDADLWTKALSKLMTGKNQSDLLLALREVHALLLQRPSLQTSDRKTALDTYVNIKKRDGPTVWTEDVARMYLTLLSRVFPGDKAQEHQQQFAIKDAPLLASPSSSIAPQRSSLTSPAMGASSTPLLSRYSRSDHSLQTLAQVAYRPEIINLAPSSNAGRGIRTSKTAPTAPPNELPSPPPDTGSLETQSGHRIRTLKTAPGHTPLNSKPSRPSKASQSSVLEEVGKKRKAEGESSSSKKPKQVADSTASEALQADIEKGEKDLKQAKKRAPKPDTEELYIPSKVVGNVMKKVLPKDVQIPEEVKDIVSECATEFILFVTNEANACRRIGGRNEVDVKSIVDALQGLGFVNYSMYMKRYKARIDEYLQKQKS